MRQLVVDMIIDIIHYYSTFFYKKHENAEIIIYYYDIREKKIDIAVISPIMTQISN